MTIELFKAWVYGQKDYIARLVELSTAVENALNQIFGQLTGQSGSLAVPYGLQEIFDRRGLIGIASYDFAEGQLSGPGYNFTVSPGTYWNAGQFYRKTTAFTLSMAGKATGTYYLSLDGAGNPLVSTSPDGTTTRQFSWDAGSHRISAKALFAGVNILFDGDDYHDMLDSAARSRSFTSVAARLEEIEQLLAEMGGYYTFDRQDGLNFYYKAGKVRNDSTIYETPSGHVTCAPSQSNYLEVDPANGTVSVNQTGFTSGCIPLYLVVTGASGITTITDKRTWAIYGAGGGGGGGGHTQNTDVGTTAHRGSWIPNGSMIATRFMELRRRRGLMAALILVNIGIPVVFLTVRLIAHAVAPTPTGRPGGTTSSPPWWRACSSCSDSSSRPPSAARPARST